MDFKPFEIYRDDYLKVWCMDDKGGGGAHHVYNIYHVDADVETDQAYGIISFQNGPIGENGVNGISNEVLLAIIKHRLCCFAHGPFPSTFNNGALSGVTFALQSLEARTNDRKERGVEGKLEK